MLTAEQMRRALRSRFGSALADDPGFAEGALDTVRSYASWRDSFAALALRMEDYLFNAVYERTGPGMTCRLDDGSSRRLLLADLSAAADEALFPFFASLRATPENYALLHAYWMDSGSFSAMRALYLCFQSFLPPREVEYIQRIVRENLPPESHDAWFNGKDVSFS